MSMGDLHTECWRKGEFYVLAGETKVILVSHAGRGKVARRLRTIKSELIEAVGGTDALSPQRALLIDAIAMKTTRAEMLWSRLMAAPAEVTDENERRLSWYLNGLRRDLAALGLDRYDSTPPPRLGELLGGEAA